MQIEMLNFKLFFKPTLSESFDFPSNTAFIKSRFDWEWQLLLMLLIN